MDKKVVTAQVVSQPPRPLKRYSLTELQVIAEIFKGSKILVPCYGRNANYHEWSYADEYAVICNELKQRLKI